jgi:molybdopterin-binding protein
MPGYRLGQAAKMLGVSVDTVRRMVDDGRLVAVRTQGGQRLIEGESLAAVAKPRRTARREAPVKQSARNRFPGIVTRVIKDRVAAQVEIQAGPHRLVSLLTREAVDELELKPGMPAIAIVKATNVSVELPRD